MKLTVENNTVYFENNGERNAIGTADEGIFIPSFYTKCLILEESEIDMINHYREIENRELI